MTKSKKKRRALTPASLGLAAGEKLSTTYSNTRGDFKTVSDVIVGYMLVGGTYTPVRVAPIYRADIWLRGVGKVNRVFSSHEIGDYYNAPNEEDGEPDHDGDALAYVAMTAIHALERHAERRRKR